MTRVLEFLCSRLSKAATEKDEVAVNLQTDLSAHSSIMVLVESQPNTANRPTWCPGPC